MIVTLTPALISAGTIFSPEVWVTRVLDWSMAIRVLPSAVLNINALTSE